MSSKVAVSLMGLHHEVERLGWFCRSGRGGNSGEANGEGGEANGGAVAGGGAPAGDNGGSDGFARLMGSEELNLDGALTAAFSAIRRIAKHVAENEVRWQEQDSTVNRLEHQVALLTRHLGGGAAAGAGVLAPARAVEHNTGHNNIGVGLSAASTAFGVTGVATPWETEVSHEAHEMVEATGVAMARAPPRDVVVTQGQGGGDMNNFSLDNISLDDYDEDDLLEGGQQQQQQQQQQQAGEQQAGGSPFQPFHNGDVDVDVDVDHPAGRRLFEEFQAEYNDDAMLQQMQAQQQAQQQAEIVEGGEYGDYHPNHQAGMVQGIVLSSESAAGEEGYASDGENEADRSFEAATAAAAAATAAARRLMGGSAMPSPAYGGFANGPPDGIRPLSTGRRVFPVPPAGLNPDEVQVHVDTMGEGSSYAARFNNDQPMTPFTALTAAFDTARTSDEPRSIDSHLGGGLPEPSPQPRHPGTTPPPQPRSLDEFEKQFAQSPVRFRYVFGGEGGRGGGGVNCCVL